MDTHVTRGWFVSIVGGTCALLVGCSRPNPAYIDADSDGETSANDGSDSRPKGTSAPTNPGDTGDSVDGGHDDDTDGDGGTRGNDEHAEDSEDDALDTADGEPDPVCPDGEIEWVEIDANADAFVVTGDCEDSSINCRFLNYGTTPEHEIADPTPIKARAPRSYLVARFPITAEIADLSEIVFTEFLVGVGPDLQAGDRLEMVAYAVGNTTWIEGEQDASAADLGESNWDNSSVPSMWAEEIGGFPTALDTMLATASTDDVVDDIAVLKAANPEMFLDALLDVSAKGTVYLNVAFTAISGRVTVQTRDAGHPPRLRVTWCEPD